MNNAPDSSELPAYPQAVFEACARIPLKVEEDMPERRNRIAEALGISNNPFILPDTQSDSNEAQ